MKKVKLLTPIISGVSLAVIVPTLVAVGSKAANNTQGNGVVSTSKSSTTNATKPMDIDIALETLPARKFMKSDDTAITWGDSTGTKTNPTAEDSAMTTIGNSAFAFSKLKSITIPGGVTEIDPMAFFHCEDLETLDLSLVQNNLLNYKNPDGGFTLGSYCLERAGINSNEETGSIVFSKFNPESTTVPTPDTLKEYNMQMAYIKAMLVNAGLNANWPIKTKTDTANTLDNVSISYSAVPVQYMEFVTSGDDKGKISGFKTDNLTSEAGYDTVIFPSFMTGFTTEGLAAWEKVKATGVIKNVFFLSPLTESNATGITVVETSWFKGWDSLEQVVLPSTVTDIEDSAFANCSKLKELDLSNVQITALPYAIAENAGRDAPTGLHIELSTTLRSIQADAFTGAGIQTLELPRSITVIDNNAFEDCNSLKKIIMSNNITAIGESAFAGCKNLETVIFDETSNASHLQKIGKNAFDECTSLKTIANSTTYTEGTFTLPANLGYTTTANGNETARVGKGAFATSTAKDVTTFKVMDFSNIPAAQAVNITFDDGAFDGWPTRGQIVGANDWTNSTWTKVLANLQAGGLSNRWVKVTADTANLLNVTYDTGTKLAINPGTFAEETAPDIEYSYTGNSTDWHQITTGTEMSLSDDYSTIYLRGNNPNGFNIPHTEGTGYQQFGVIQFTNSSATKGVQLTGNVMGLIDNGTGTLSAMPTTHCFDKLFFGSTALQTVNSGFLSSCSTLTESCYQAMFMGCTNLKSAPSLPAQNLAKECYYNMFRNSGITDMPKLSATTMAESCYESMFQGCTSLKTVCDLPTTPTLAPSCFKNMFNGCTTMATAPKLPETDDRTEIKTGESTTKISPLANNCYEGMFSGCKALSKAPTLSARLIPQEAYKNMFTGCTALTTAPTIYVPSDSDKYSFGTDCYKEMFKDCTGLTKMKVRFSIWPMDSQTTPVQATTDWVKDLTPGGTFVCPKVLPHTETYFNSSQIPVDWTVEESDEDVDPYNPDEVNQPVGAKVREDTNITLLNFGTNEYATSKSGSTRPDFRVMIVDSEHSTPKWESIYDGDSEGTFEKQGDPKTLLVKAGGTVYFKGVNPNGWSHEPTSGTSWTDNYSSIWFSRPTAKVSGDLVTKTVGGASKRCENYIDSETGLAPTSTGVSIFGNIMSLVLKSSTSNGDVYWSENVEPTKYCFANLFRGRDKMHDGETDDASEAAACNYYQHNYCIETISDTFMSIPLLSDAIFSKEFAYCPNLTTGAKVWSRADAGKRTTKFKAFGDTYQSTGLVTPPEYNLDCIESEADGKETFHGTLIYCDSLTETPKIPIKDLSKLTSSSATWGWAYAGDKKLQTIYCYVDMEDYSSYSMSIHNNVFGSWLDADAGTDTSDSSVEKKIYMSPSFYTYLCDTCNIVKTETKTEWVWDNGHPDTSEAGKDKDWSKKHRDGTYDYLYNESGTDKNGSYVTTTTTTITYLAFGTSGQSVKTGSGPQGERVYYYPGLLPLSKDNRWKVYNIYNQTEELVWTPTGLLYI